MTAASLEIRGQSGLRTGQPQDRLQRLARTSGILYLVLFALGMFSPLVIEALVVPGDAATTAENISESLGLFRSSLVTWMVIVAVDVAISVTLYLLLAPISKTLSMVAAGFRIAYSVLLGVFLTNLFDAHALLTGGESAAGMTTSEVNAAALAALERFSDGFVFALAFFGAHLIVLGVLLVRSRYMPRVIGVVLSVAGLGYIADMLGHFFIEGHSDTASIILLTPALIGELAITVWLLFKGVRTRDF